MPQDQYDAQEALLSAAVSGRVSRIPQAALPPAPDQRDISLTIGSARITFPAVLEVRGDRDWVLVPTQPTGFLQLAGGTRVTLQDGEAVHVGTLRHALTWQGKDVFSFSVKPQKASSAA